MEVGGVVSEGKLRSKSLGMLPRGLYLDTMSNDEV